MAICIIQPLYSIVDAIVLLCVLFTALPTGLILSMRPYIFIHFNNFSGSLKQFCDCSRMYPILYPPLLRLQIEVSTKPQRLTEQMDKAVTNNFKPVSNHVANVRTLPYHTLKSVCVCLHAPEGSISL